MESSLKGSHQRFIETCEMTIVHVG
ncbi:hypothetical protein [Anoxybacillus sp. CHMUD]|nr:hypothetical protein [Anoxybacillus sp. CHMUD]